MSYATRFTVFHSISLSFLEFGLSSSGKGVSVVSYTLRNQLHTRVAEGTIRRFFDMVPLATILSDNFARLSTAKPVLCI